MHKPGTWYENTVAEIARLIYPSATVRVRQQVEGPEGNREVDVDIRWIAEDNKPHFVLLECKDRKAPVDIPAIDGLHSKSLDLKPNLTIIYSNSGFTKKALDKARRLSIAAMSALWAGEERIRHVSERLFVAKALIVDRFALAIYPSDGTDEIPLKWEPADLSFQGLPVLNWLSALSRDLLLQHQDAKVIIWTTAFLRETEFTIHGQPVILRGFRLTLACSQKYVSQIVREDVSVGAFDHLRRGVIVPSGQTYTIGAFDRASWEDYDGTSDEGEGLPPDTFSMSMLLCRHVPTIPGAGVPALDAVLNPADQKIEIH